MEGDEDTEEVDWETGPFCRHWSDPSECDALCKCGHKCSRHWAWDNHKCKDCECHEFIDKDNTQQIES